MRSSNQAGSQAQDTNEVVRLFVEFLFGANSLMTWIHLGILAGGIFLACWAARLDPNKLPKSFRCPAFAREVIQLVRANASAFLVSFGIGFAMFLAGVAFQYVPSVPSLIVQVMTYIPTLVLALVQLLTTLRAVRLVKKHTGL